MNITFTKLSEKAIAPKQMVSAAEAASDLFSTDGYILQPGERRLFKTHISCAIPEGYYGRIAPRSGLAYKHGIDVLAGVIDSSYRGDIGVILINLGQEPYEVLEGDRIAQFIIQPCMYISRDEVDDLEANADRGEKGFGSSGR